MNKFTADFETATWLEDETYVWAWATCEINNPENLEIGNTIDTFFEYCNKFHNPTFYLHNLKFDGEFIIHYLLTHGFEHIKSSKDRKDNSFTTLISDMGMFYQIVVYLKVGNKKTNKITFIDSLKIIPFSVSDIAKSFGLPISKLELDYNLPRELGHILTEDERAYIKNDVKIVALALQTLFAESLTSITSASNAVKDFKTTHSKRRFDRLFPQLPYEIDKDMRQAYKGGFTYLNDIYEEKDVMSGVVLDVNSLRSISFSNV